MNYTKHQLLDIAIVKDKHLASTLEELIKLAERGEEPVIKRMRYLAAHANENVAQFTKFLADRLTPFSPSDRYIDGPQPVAKPQPTTSARHIVISR